MNFPEILAAMAALEAADRPEDMFDQFQVAYDNDIGLGTAKVGELEAQIALLTAEVSKLKSHNYDLLMSIPGDLDPDPDPKDPESAGLDDDDTPTIESLFEEKK